MLLAVVAVLATLCWPSVFAWGFVGHQLVASLAEDFLTAEAWRQVHVLVPRDNLTTIATWADQIKRNPKYRWSSSLHYVNPIDREPESCSFQPSRDCVGGQCVTGAVLNFTAQLQTPSLPFDQRVDALKFLVHFIGDLHQPLHVSGRDRGGNDAHCRFGGSGGRKFNLHSVWDSALIKKRMLDDFGGNFLRFRQYLLQRRNDPKDMAPLVSQWMSCHSGAADTQPLLVDQSSNSVPVDRSVPTRGQSICPNEWALQVNQFNCDYVWRFYSPTADLSLDYYQKNRDAMERLLVMASVRLAATLNAIFQH